MVFNIHDIILANLQAAYDDPVTGIGPVWDPLDLSGLHYSVASMNYAKPSKSSGRPDTIDIIPAPNPTAETIAVTVPAPTEVSVLDTWVAKHHVDPSTGALMLRIPTLPNIPGEGEAFLFNLTAVPAQEQTRILRKMPFDITVYIPQYTNLTVELDETRKYLQSDWTLLVDCIGVFPISGHKGPTHITGHIPVAGLLIGPKTPSELSVTQIADDHAQFSLTGRHIGTQDVTYTATAK